MQLVRKPLLLVFALVTAAVGLAACGSSGSSSGGGSVSKPEGTIRVMGEEGMFEAAMLAGFEKEYPDVKIESVEVEGSSEAATKLSAGFSADVVETCTGETEPLLERGLLQTIDTSKLASWDELDSSLRTAKGTQQDGKQTFIPLLAGPHGLIYNTEAFPEGVTEIKELFNPELKGEVAMGGSDLSMIPMAAFSLGIKEPYSMSEAQLEEVGEYLDEHASQFRTFPESDANQLSLMKSGEVVLMDGGLGTAYEMIEGGVPVKWVAPKEGMYAWACGLAITKDAKNVNAAYALINYYASSTPQTRFGDEGYVVVNKNSVAKVEPTYRKTADPSSIDGAIMLQTPSNPQKWLEIYQGVISG
ncbi:MAG: extracellular solute-binding protein [Solirubrobacterales bacterium]